VGKQLLPAEGFVMSTNGTPRPQGWKDLYARAMLETDPAKLSPLIADAHKAILDRIQETLTKPACAEREPLSDALNGLRTLRHEVGGAKPTATALTSGNRTELASWLRVESTKLP
jgi:hypothetical protein